MNQGSVTPNNVSPIINETTASESEYVFENIDSILNLEKEQRKAIRSRTWLRRAKSIALVLTGSALLIMSLANGYLVFKYAKSAYDETILTNSIRTINMEQELNKGASLYKQESS